MFALDNHVSRNANIDFGCPASQPVQSATHQHPSISHHHHQPLIIENLCNRTHKASKPQVIIMAGALDSVSKSVFCWCAHSCSLVLFQVQTLRNPRFWNCFLNHFLSFFYREERRGYKGKHSHSRRVIHHSAVWEGKEGDH